MFKELMSFAKQCVNEEVIDVTNYLGGEFYRKKYMPLFNKYLTKLRKGISFNSEQLANEFVKVAAEPLKKYLDKYQNCCGDDFRKIISMSFSNFLNLLNDESRRKIK